MQSLSYPGQDSAKICALRTVILQEATAASPTLAAAGKLAATEARKVLRRLHVPRDRRDRKEALKPFGRMLAKATHANALPVFQTIVGQVFPRSGEQL